MSASSDLRPRPSLPGGVPRPARGLLAAVAASLAVVVLSDLFALVAGVRIHLLIDEDHGFLTAPQRELDAAYLLYERAGSLQVMTFLPCAVLFVVWFFRMRRNAGLLGPDRLRNGPGWAIGAWFVPLGNLWMPYRVAVDMWGASSQLPADGEPYRMPVWPVNLWWALFVASTLFGRYAESRYDDAESLAEVRDAVVQYMVTDVLDIAAAAAAVYFAVRLTSMQRLKAAEGPYRTAVPGAA
ncbi:hypothetical protein SLINC_6637 [Streptomyces lincolnensis]|uniref:DUF4328 domain-containing protein n=1 Tax=Streptomyces lincolnensis TaxID=1915 RepID=A0A1B1MJT8_STRLN|nr:DUF4328 domain-containing protein [Streptomyces lincolnensis]ANS68861.1 hypothetical protein SLINC_6637 [Streptomyces lincolnensis]AXG52933.1 hypothetical protein SLCG_1778 [Streptomyces lincolnensis]QMV10462.1 DUF4328 domain-containing protein [Streptomyces lincolnensis]